MTYNNDDFNQLNNNYSIPDRPQSPQWAVPIPISITARQKAAEMAELCRKADRKATMRRNLLATIVMNDYLRLQGYLPDIQASDCWNPILGRTGEIADLFVSQVGRFECCAINPDQSICAVPAEGQFDRSGYLAVEIGADERWGWLLGFIPSGDDVNAVETLNRESLQSMDEFGYHLHRLWLLWTIVQEADEHWDVELRSAMVTLLERTYRTRSAAQRPMRAAAEITQLWGEEVTGAEPRDLVGASREGDSSAQPELRQFLRGVFDRFDDLLEIEEGTDNGR